MPIPVIVGIGALLTALWSRLYIFLLFLVPWLLQKGIAFLGVGVVSYYGFNFLLDNLKSWVFSNFDMLPADLLAILVLARVDDCVAVYFAAHSLLISVSIFQKWKVNKSNTLTA